MLQWFRKKVRDDAEAPQGGRLRPRNDRHGLIQARRRAARPRATERPRRRRGSRGGRGRKKPGDAPARRRRPRRRRPRSRRPSRGARTRADGADGRGATPRVCVERPRRAARGQEGDPRLRRRRRAARRAPRGRQAGRGLPRASRAAARSRATSTRASSTTCSQGWRPRSSRSASTRTASSTSTRSSSPSSRASATGAASRSSSSAARRCSSRPSRTRWARRARASRRRSRSRAASSSTRPFGEGVGISRRLEDAERDRLKAITKELELGEGGIIVRTAAEGASKEELEGDLALLRSSGRRSRAARPRTKAPALVYQEAELPLRIVRDLFIRDFERVVVDHDRTYRRIVGYLRRTSQGPRRARRALHGQGAADGEVGRRGGGPLHAEPARRPAVGRLPDLRLRRGVHRDRRQHGPLRRRAGQGERRAASRTRSRRTTSRPSQEVVRQLRLRDIGGIIVIDFIDMANPKNRAARSRTPCATSSSATGRRPTSSRSRRSAWSR